jgi:tetratricopeptide (TPR) repeat protein
VVVVLSYNKLKQFETLVDAYRELYEDNVFDYVEGVNVTNEIISLSKELEEHYQHKTKSSDKYYSPLMEAIRVFFKSQRYIIEVSNQLFKMEINDSLFSFVDKTSLNKIKLGNMVLDTASERDAQKIKETFSDALEHIKPILPELEAALKKVSEAKDQDMISMLDGAVNLLKAKISFFNSIVAVLEKKFGEAVQNLEESIQCMERAIKNVKTNLDTLDEAENAKKTEAYLRLLINNYRTAVSIIKKHASD